jgi:hypothetical protein
MRLHQAMCISLLIISGCAFAAPITYSVTANTAAIAGTVGSLDFNFNPGPGFTQAASVQIIGFSSDGTVDGGALLTGDASGSLPSTVLFDNGTGYNDYFQTFTYGSTLSFEISLFGPALSAPDGISTSGSAFAFSLFSDPAGTTPVLTSDLTDGFAYTVNVNLDGTTTATDYLIQSTTPVPEPSSITLFLIGYGCLFGLSKARTIC